MDSAALVHPVRRFNRFYTRQIGVLQDRFLGTPFSLAEGRVLQEIALHDQVTATDVGRALGLDAGYVSRVLRSFGQRGLIRRTRSSVDRRSVHLSLTRSGHAAFARLDRQSHNDVAAMLRRLAPGAQRRLIAAMRVIEQLMGATEDGAPSFVLRSPQAGDFGWIVHRQGVLYAEEWGYNEEFEALVAEIVAAFVQHLRPSKERCWIAEREGEVVGSVFLVQKSKTVAQLRLLLVEPHARGLGIGSRLIAECVRFAQRAGYRKITLWTQSELDAARRLYKKAGFTLTSRKTHDSFGKKRLVAETWDLQL